MKYSLAVIALSVDLSYSDELKQQFLCPKHLPLPTAFAEIIPRIRLTTLCILSASNAEPGVIQAHHPLLASFGNPLFRN